MGTSSSKHRAAAVAVAPAESLLDKLSADPTYGRAVRRTYAIKELHEGNRMAKHFNVECVSYPPPCAACGARESDATRWTLTASSP